MQNRHQRRKAAKLDGVPMQKKVHQPRETYTVEKEAPNFSVDDYMKMYRTGIEGLYNNGILPQTEALLAKTQVNVSERNLQLSISLLAFVLTRILDAYQFSKTHPQTRQSEQLRISIEYIGEYEKGGRLDNQLETTIENAKLNLDVVSDVYEQLGYARNADDSEADLEEGWEVIKIATSFKDGVKKLLNKVDQGQTLIAAIETYQGEIQRLRGAAMQGAAPDYGGRKAGATPITLEIGKRLITIWDKSRREQELTKVGNGLIARLKDNNEPTDMDRTILDKLIKTRDKGPKNWSNFLNRAVKIADLDNHS